MQQKLHPRRGKRAQKLSVVRGEKADKSVEIAGVTVSGTQKDLVLRKMWLQRKELLHVATVNSEYIMAARRDPSFVQVLSQCITVADGWGVVWAAKLLYGIAIERITGVGLVEEILKHASQKGEKVFLLGASVGVAERAATEMRKIYPRLQISWYEGAQSVRVEKNEEASMTIARINAYEPDYLFVAYGSPEQDLWIEANRPYLRARVAMGVGGALDEWAGVSARCPRWLDELGLKWLWRLLHEPWRVGRVARVWGFGGWVLYHKLID